MAPGASPRLARLLGVAAGHGAFEVVHIDTHFKTRRVCAGTWTAPLLAAVVSYFSARNIRAVNQFSILSCQHHAANGGGGARPNDQVGCF